MKARKRRSSVSTGLHQIAWVLAFGLNLWFVDFGLVLLKQEQHRVIEAEKRVEEEAIKTRNIIRLYFEEAVEARIESAMLRYKLQRRYVNPVYKRPASGGRAT